MQKQLNLDLASRQGFLLKSVLSEVLIKNPFDATLAPLSIFRYLGSKSKMAAKMARKMVVVIIPLWMTQFDSNFSRVCRKATHT
jgi:hypothetical protein